MAQIRLIGTDPSQVPTNGMLGNLAFQNAESVSLEKLVVTGDVGIGTTNPIAKLQVVGSTELSKLNLSGISSSISSTAVDVFVYDTRKDSDGGAWRKRTQSTSWYNETLNTATRGSRRDFPAVAVIVIDGTFPNKVTIYDGDDPDLPMWMVFETGRTPTLRALNWWTSGNGLSGVNSVVALNGLLVISPGNGTVNFDFIKDSTRISYGPIGSDKYQIFPGTILTRNNYTTVISNGDGYVLVHSNVNDVAMTVLPNAPIDPSTSLPVPTIAVATQGGTSIIRDDGTVTNAGGTITTKISINEKGIVYYASTANGGYYGYSLVGGSLDSFFNTIGNLRILSNTNNNTNNNLVVPNAFNLYSGQTIGLTIVNKDFLNTYNDYNGMVAYATTSYNTGWMHGDIKGAFLSDTSTASVTGTELITNGTFDSNTTGWTASTSTNTWSSGTMQITRSGGVGLATYQAFTTVVGQRYVATATINSSGSRGDLYIINGTGWGGTQLGITTGTFGQTRQITVYFTATSTTTTLAFAVDQNGTSIFVDNVSVRREESDRSVNNKGLAVYGTITKTAVATGSNLVAYSGFSDGDYLKQPHNSSLEFGTGSFSCTVWFKSSTADVNNYKGLVYLNQNGSAGVGFQILLSPSNGIYFYIYGPTNNFSGTPHTGYNDGNWHQISVSSTGTHQRVYLDGVLKETGNITTGSITDTSSELFIGKWYANTSSPYYWRGSIALYRISSSIPSPEQILKIYNDEKMLFQENSQCTLYGSSDAVTALAYDDTTDLLSVGTSSGRSDFSGLKRINNTTTAVTTAISASNGLIAEQ